MALQSDRTVFIATQESKETAKDRTAPVYTINDGQLALNDVLQPKPNDFNGQIDITWIDEALEKKAFESKYSAWDLIKFPYGNCICSSFGNGIGVFIYPNLAVLTNSYGDVLENVTLNNSDIICITYAEYQLEKISDIGEVTYIEIKAFVMLSLDGKCYYTLDNFKTIKEFTIPNESYSEIIFYNNQFFAFTTTGKIYKSDNQGKEILNISSFDIQFNSVAFNENGAIISCGSNIGVDAKDRIIYSLDFGETWHSLDVTNKNTYTDIVYGEGKFVCCSPDGVEKLLIIKHDVENKNLSAYPKSLIKDYQFIKLSYGSRVFVLISLDGSILSSYDGENFIETKSALTGFINILRTDKFFIALSYNENNLYNAVRSANGGLNSIDFATVQEIIDNEKTNKSIDIQGANGWFNWLENERGITAQDVRICILDDLSPVIDVNELPAGYYMIRKYLNNIPENIGNDPVAFSYFLKIYENDGFHLNSVKEKQVFYEIYTFISEYFIKYINFTDIDREITSKNWQKQLYRQEEIYNIDLSKDNVEVTKKSTISAVRTFLAVDNNGNVSTIDSIDLSDDKITVSQTITQSAVRTFLIVDNQGNVKQSSLEEIKEFIGLKKLAYKDIIDTEDIKDGAIDLSSKKISNILSEKNGGTGVTTKHLFFNIVTFPELRTIFPDLGNSSVTTLEFVNAVKSSTNLNFKVNLVSAKIYISDCPLDNCILEVTRLTDNTVILTAKELFNMSTFEFRKSLDGTYTGWIQTIFPNGFPFGIHDKVNPYKNYACNVTKAPFFNAPTMTIEEFVRAAKIYIANTYKDNVVQYYFAYKKDITNLPEDLIIELHCSENSESNTASIIGRSLISENIYYYNFNKSTIGFVKLNNNSLDPNIIIALFQSNPSAFRNALGLGSLSVLNSVDLSDLTKTTGILPSARGGFNYQDYLG